VSTYRRKAIELLPELKQEIERAEGYGDVDVLLSDQLDQAIQEQNSDRVRRILQYGFWCQKESGEPQVAESTVCGMWWHIFRYSHQENQLVVLKITEKYLGKDGLRRVYNEHWKGLVPAHFALRFGLEERGFKDLWGGIA